MKEATIVFDLDGTLVDTAPDLINATNHVMEHIGAARVDPKIARTWISHGARVMIERSLTHADIRKTPEDVDTLLALFLEHYSAHIADESRPYPDVVPVLKALLEQGARLGVCTNKRERLAREVLEELGLAPLFCALAGRDTLPVFKPDGGHILGTIEMAGGTPSRAVMVGDSANDVDGAKSAGIPCIAVTFGYSSTPAAALGADVTIDHYRELEPQLKALLAAVGA